MSPVHLCGLKGNFGLVLVYKLLGDLQRCVHHFVVAKFLGQARCVYDSFYNPSPLIPPHTILEKRGETDYVLRTPNRRRHKRVCHINMLKAYHTRDDRESLREKEDDSVHPVGVACNKS